MHTHIGSFPVRRIAGSSLIAAVLFVGLSTPASAQTARNPVLGILLDPPTSNRLWVQPTVLTQLGGRDSAWLHAPTDILGRTGMARGTDLARKVEQEVGEFRRSIDYSGPRFGMTYLPKAAVDSLKNHKIEVGTAITQFGWQLEHEIHVSAQGPRILNEWVFLAGGLESGVFLPSLTWLVGARDVTGNEIGVGPNVSVAGVGLAAAAGITIHDGGVNFPMNIAVAKSKTGLRVSFLTGFTIH